MKETWIIGSGRFGLLALERLAKIRSGHHIVVVDADRENLSRGAGADRTLEQMDGVEFLNQRLRPATAPEWIIPALPVHLAAQWCLARQGLQGLRQIAVPADVDPDVPNPARDPAGNLYTSHADFICPDDCVESAGICTVTQKRRTADMFELLGRIRLSGFQSLVIRSHQLGPGVGGYRPRQLFNLLEQIKEGGKDFLLSTACRCHGVMTGLGYRN